MEREEGVFNVPFGDNQQSGKGSYSVNVSVLDTLSDEELVTLAHEGNHLAYETLILRYKNLVRSKARTYFLVGADKEDIVQEGMLGIFKAIRDFKQDKPASFRGFAELCVTRQIITAIKTATRNKHIPLNTYISLSRPMYDEDSDRVLSDVINKDTVLDPEQIIISREDISGIEKKMMQALSRFEYEVLEKYLDGCSYQEISEQLGRHVKSIDNALQRIKRKLEMQLVSC